MVATNRPSIPSLAAFALLLGLTAAARADLFTYDVLAVPGLYGPLSGSITISGNAGETFALDSSFDGVTSFNFQWNGGSIGTFDFNSSNTSVDALLSLSPIDFDAALGSPVLNTVDGVLTLVGAFYPGSYVPSFIGDEALVLTGFAPSEWGIELLNTGTEDSFGIDLNSGSDAGFYLSLASVSSTPLPSDLQIGLVGMSLLAAWSIFRNSKHPIAQL
jgi:hypothetical protein